MSLEIRIHMTWQEDGEGVTFRDDSVRNLSLIGQVDVSCQSMPYGSFSVELLTDANISLAKMASVIWYGDYPDNYFSYICTWPIKTTEPIDGKYIKVVCKSWLGLLEGKDLDEKKPTETGDTGFDGMIPSWIIMQNIPTVSRNSYAPQQSARERAVWAMFVDGKYISDYGCYRDYSEQRPWVRDGTFYINYVPFCDEAELIPLERTFANATFSYRERIGLLGLTGYTFFEAQSLLVDGDDYRFPEPWTALQFDYSSDGSVGADENGEIGMEPEQQEVTGVDVQIRKVLIENIYNVPLDAQSVFDRMCEYYFNPRDLTIDVINAFEYCAGDRVIVYIADDKLVSGIIERADYTVGHRVRSTLKLACVVDVPGAWLTLNYKVGNNVIGYDRRYLPLGKAYSIDNHNLTRFQSGRVITYSPVSPTTTGRMGQTDKTISVPYAIMVNQG